MKTLLAAALAFGIAAPTLADTLTYHFDQARTGWKPNEITLTPANVAGLKLLASVPLDDFVHGQPLVYGGQVYIGTEGGSLYEVDAATDAVTAVRRLGAYPLGRMPDCPPGDAQTVGINSTPVIDPTTSRMYLTDLGSDGVLRVYTLSLPSLADALPPQVVSAAAPLHGRGLATFDPLLSRQRAALLLSQGHLYAGTSTFCADAQREESRGWLLDWTVGAVLQPESPVLLDDAHADFLLSSIWMSNAGPAANPAGLVYAATGNSDPARPALSQSVVRWNYDLSSRVAWSPNDRYELNVHDYDLGSGGVELISGTDYVVAAGKTGRMYLLRDDGGTMSEVGSYDIGHCWCSESVYERYVVSSGGDQIKLWELGANGLRLVARSPVLPHTDDPPNSDGYVVGQAGFFTSVSGKGDDVLVWAVGRPVPGSPPTLYAWDPANPDAWAFEAPTGTWSAHGANLNAVPVVDGGRVYVATQGLLDVWGLAP